MALLFVLWLVSLASSSHLEHEELKQGPFYVYAYQQRVQLSSFDESVSTTIGQHADNSKVVAVDYDSRSGLVYVVDEAASTITASNSTHTLLVVSRLNKPRGIAFDWINSTLYWTEQTAIRYCRVNLGTGCRPSSLHFNGPGTPHAIAVDPQRQELYWSELGESARISSLVLRNNAYTMKVLMSKQLLKPTAVTVEHSTGHVYWADPQLPAVGCIRCQKQHIFVKFASVRYQPFSLSVFNGRVYFFNKRQLDGGHSFYSLPTTKWTHWYNTQDCINNKCAVTIRPQKELTLSQGSGNVFDFVIINGTLKVPVSNFAFHTSPPVTTETTVSVSTTSTTESQANASSLVETVTSVPSSSSSSSASLSVVPTQLTDQVEAQSKNFWLSLHPGILAAAAAVVCAMLLTIVLVLSILICRKQKFNGGNTNKGFSSLERSSPSGSEYEHPVAPATHPPSPTVKVAAPQYADIMSITDLVQVPVQINNPTYTGEMAPAPFPVSEQQGRQAEENLDHVQNLMKDPANLTNPNYDAVIEIDQVNNKNSEQKCDSLHPAIPHTHYYNNLISQLRQQSDQQNAEDTCRVGRNNMRLPPPIYDTPADQSPQSTTTVSTTSQSSQLSQSTESQSNNSEYETTYHLQVPQKPQCTQTI